MKFAKTLCFAAAAALTSTAVLASSPFEEAKDAVHYRQAAFSLIRVQFGEIRAMLKGEKPYDQAQMERRAENMANLASLPWEAFIQGTAQGTDGLHTDALPAIWQKKADFDKGGKMFEKNAKALMAAAKSGDKGMIKKAVGAVGKTCKGCHDNFKD